MSRRPNIRVCLVLLALSVAATAGAQSPAPAEAPTAPASRSPAEVRQQLDEVMRRPLYQRWKLRQGRELSADERSAMSWIDEWGGMIERWIGDWLRRDDGARPNGAGGASALGAVLHGVGYVLLAGLGIAVAVIAVMMLRQSRQKLSAADVLGRGRIEEALESGDALAMGDAQWLREAQRLARQTEFRAAYRALYLALLSGLHRLHHIDFRHTRTNWQYVASFRGPEPQRAEFSELTGVFDEVWYGQKPAVSQDLQQMQRRVGSLLGNGGEA